MDDIVFPMWVNTSATLATASLVARTLTAQYTGSDRNNSLDAFQRADKRTVQEDLVHARVRGEVAAEEEREALREDGKDGEMDSEEEEEETMADVLVRQQNDMNRRKSDFNYNDNAEQSQSKSTSDAVRQMLNMNETNDSYNMRRFSSVAVLHKDSGFRQDSDVLVQTDILYRLRVQLLFENSNIEVLSSETSVVVTKKHAIGLVSLLAFAVGAKDIPSKYTRGFYTECSSLFTNFLANVKNLEFTAGVDVPGLIASLVACALKLRRSPNANKNMSRSASSENLHKLHSSSNNNYENRSTSGSRQPSPRAGSSMQEEGNLGFEHQLIDPLLLALLPEDIDVCVKDSIAIGVLEGLALTYTRAPVYLGSQLVMRLHNLADAFAASTRRRDIMYKKLLCVVLEGLSCSCVINYERANSWITAIIQPQYVVKGLFQKEVLHARVVSATLVLLIRQYQEMSQEYVERDYEKGKSVPDFTEGDELIGLLWGALQNTYTMWSEEQRKRGGNAFVSAATTPQNVDVEDSSTTLPAVDNSMEGGKPAKTPTLYSQNLRNVVQNLLRVEVERLRCYYLMTGQPQQASNGAGRVGERGAEQQEVFYCPSEEEESLRIEIITNIVKFMLSPSSVMKLIPSTGASAIRLRATITESCAHVLSIAASNRFVSLSVSSSSSPSSSNVQYARGLLHNQNADPAIAAGGNGRELVNRFMDRENTFYAMAAFSNRYYHRLEQLLHELIGSIVNHNGIAINSNNSNEANRGAESFSSSSEDTLTALCIENISVADPRLVSYASSEVMDRVVQLTSKRNTFRSATEKSGGGEHSNNHNGTTSAQNRANHSTPNNMTNSAYSLSLCLNMLSEIVVPQRYSILHLVGLRDLARFGQLLCDNYEDSLRDTLANSSGETLHDAFKKREVPTITMQVAAESFYKLVVRVHERILSITKDALEYTPDSSNIGNQENNQMDGNPNNNNDGTRETKMRQQLRIERKRYLRVLNREGESVRLLTKTLIKCLLNICWPGSGIIYQKKSGSTRPADQLTSPQGMAGLSKACISPFLSSLCLLFHLGTLFPMNQVRPLAHHVEYGGHLLRNDMSDQYIAFYYFQPSKLNFHFEKEENANLFRSFWLMMCFYGFAREALDISTQKIKAESAQAAPSNVHNVTPDSEDSKAANNNTTATGREAALTAGVINGVSTLLTEKEAKQVRLLATSAPPLLRMTSSEMSQCLADIAVLLRYIDIGGNPVAESGESHHTLVQRLADLATEAAASSASSLHAHSRKHYKKWLKKLNTSELYLMQSLAELELLRASSGSIANLTVYNQFEIREFVASPQMKNVLLEIMSTVSAQYLVSLNTLPPGIAPRLIAKDIHQLLLMFSFSVDSVRRAARLILEMIINAFPAYSTYAGELPLLWTVINLIDSGTDQELERLCRRLHYQETAAINPDRDSVERRTHLEELVELAQYWQEKATVSAPVALFAQSTKFVFFQEMMGGGGPAVSSSAGFRLATLAAQPAEKRLPANATKGILALGDPCNPSYAGALIKISTSQGQILSALRLAPFVDVEESVLKYLMEVVRAGRSKANVLSINEQRTRLRRVWQAVEGAQPGGRQPEHHAVAKQTYASSSPDVSSGKLYEFESAVGSAIALLGTGAVRSTVAVSLIRYVGQSALILFHSHYIKGAMQSWRWLLSVNREKYSLLLLQQLVEGMEYTIVHRLGLFDGLQPSQSNQVQTGDFHDAELIRHTYPEDYDAESPHSLLFGFLAEEYLNPGCISSQDPTQLRYLYELGSRIVSAPELWSLKDTSFAETMRVSAFLIHTCRTVHYNNVRRLKLGLDAIVPFTSLGVLRQRLYLCLLRWFRQDPPRWYFARQPALALDQVNVLLELMHVLREEHTSVSRSSLGFVDVYYHGGNKNPEALASQRKEQERLADLLHLLRTLVEHDLLRIRIWQNPRRSLEVPEMTPISSWQPLVMSATLHDPAVAVALVSRFSSNKEIKKLVCQMVVQAPDRFANVPGAVDLYLTEEVLQKGAPQLFLFVNGSIVQALRLLDKRYAKYPAIPKYAIRSLLSQESKHLIFYLPQLLQVLATDQSGAIEEFLFKCSHKSIMFCHQLLWALQTEGEGQTDLAAKCRHLSERITTQMTPEEQIFYQSEFAFTNLVTSLSGELMQFDKPQRKPNLRLRLRDAEFHDAPAQAHIYLPTDVEFRVLDVIPHTAGAMQSAAKCPILVQFQCVPRDAEDRRLPTEIAEDERKEAEEGGEQKMVVAPVVKACIFKMGDDCRQDQLSLQLMELFKRVLDSVGVPFYLYPYRVVTTGQESGIIEVVPNSHSRNEIGKLVETNLAEFFVQTFGHPESVSFKRAKNNFIQSTAAYSIFSFILNIKDRHNGNIMINNEGHLVHIDFGFLFDTSPGGDMNFESSPFKLTTEMVQLIGKDVGSDSKLLNSSKALSKALVDEDSYIYFKVLVNRIYLAIRQHAKEICTLVELMLRSGLPCFKPKQTIANLAQRLAMDKDEVAAADYMRKRIHESRQNFRTVLYDHYQRIAEGIAM